MLTYAINIPFHILPIKIPVCWDVVLSNSVIGISALAEHVIDLEDGGSTYLQNLTTYLLNYVVLYPRRLSAGRS
jgi:hypothetical protein